jgi:hypothetical protein
VYIFVVAEFIHFTHPVIRPCRELWKKKRRSKDALRNGFQVYQFKAGDGVLYEDKR